MNKILFSSLLLAASQPMTAQETSAPNIVLILCDDMGFSDLGCYGSEIQTPNIDKLASEGVRFSQFKNTGRSCPSRASLLTGRYQHEVGMGWMAEVDEHRPGYRGQIDKAYPTIAEVMKAGGYRTYMSGKWHVTATGGYDAPNGSYPVQRGFERYYGCLHGGAVTTNQNRFTMTCNASPKCPMTIIIPGQLQTQLSLLSTDMIQASQCFCIWLIMLLICPCRLRKNM